jgi:hypothetical protein
VLIVIVQHLAVLERMSSEAAGIVQVFPSSALVVMRNPSAAARSLLWRIFVVCPSIRKVTLSISLFFNLIPTYQSDVLQMC